MVRPLKGERERWERISQLIVYGQESELKLAAVKEGRRRRSGAALISARQVFAHALQVDVIVELRRKPRHVECLTWLWSAASRA